MLIEIQSGTKKAQCCFLSQEKLTYFFTVFLSIFKRRAVSTNEPARE